jgi:ATP-dependent RNA helicase DeaD
MTKRDEQMRFEDLRLKPQTLTALKQMGYDEPTEVQEKIVPLIIGGKNILARSKTGTGKTAAFGIGIVERLAAKTAKKTLVLAPTRELTLQVAREVEQIALNYPIKVVTVYGGNSINPQIDALRRGVDILVATPGRLLDHARRRTVDLSHFNIVVLDEADRMLDMGFRDEMDQVMNLIPKERTVLLLSATLDSAIMSAASRYMKTPQVIEIGEKEKPQEIHEEEIEATRFEKFSKLREILKQHPEEKMIIFSATKYFSNTLADKLTYAGFKADRLHGDMSQAARESVLRKFKEGMIQILVATDVAARGLHVDDVGLIINYDKAADEDTHLHRVGRTGRMGSAGKAITFIDRKESKEERFSESHPDFAWMQRGRDPAPYRRPAHSRPISRGPPYGRSSGVHPPHRRPGSRPTHGRPRPHGRPASRPHDESSSRSHRPYGRRPARKKPKDSD